MSDPFLQQETTRIQLHFDGVEKNLLSKDVNHLPGTIKTNRLKHIETLHNYAQTGIFPRNYDFPDQRIPCFIDVENRPCAVAHLMIASGKDKLAYKISELANYARIYDIAKLELSEIEEWVKESGLSLEELAMIQPSYDFMKRFRLLTRTQKTQPEKKDKYDQEKNYSDFKFLNASNQNKDLVKTKNPNEAKKDENWEWVCLSLNNTH